MSTDQAFPKFDALAENYRLAGLLEERDATIARLTAERDEVAEAARVYIAERDAARAEVEALRMAEAEAMALVLNHEGHIERQTATLDELLCALGALIERYAFDGVPNDSLPVWQEARGVHARVIADSARKSPATPTGSGS